MAQSQDDAVSVHTAASADALLIHTPEDTTSVDVQARCEDWSTGVSFDAVPWPGKTYMIRDRESGRAITFQQGNLFVDSTISKLGGWHWTCVESDGWLGFQNFISGTYIGHDGKNGNFISKSTSHKQGEWLCARRHPGGGYLLLSRQGDKLCKIAITENNRLVRTEKEGTVWEFILL